MAAPPPPPAPPAAMPAAAPAAPRLPKPPVKDNPLKYIFGVPTWVLEYRPKMPGRNMSIFLAVTSSVLGAYIYDRRECERLQKEYLDKVRWMREGVLETGDLARRIKVYGARVPEDGELERSSKWFKKYIKPLLVASATDYSLTTGTNPGGLGRTLVAEIRARRLAEAAQSQAGAAYNDSGVVLGNVLDVRDRKYEAAEIDGGILLLGRGALKEYLWALRKGYGEDIDLGEEARLAGLGMGAGERRKDGRWEREEEVMVRELDAEDVKSGSGPFDIIVPDVDVGELDSSDPTTDAASSPLSVAYAPYRTMATMPAPTPTSVPFASTSSQILPAPIQLPQQPPVLLVPFSHPFGVREWPQKLVHFFNKRSDVKLGGEYALMIINGKTRPFANPTIRTETGQLQGMLDDVLVEEVRVGGHKDLTMEPGTPTGSKDVDFLLDLEEIPSYFRKTYRTLPSAHEYARRQYYTVDLPPKLAQARELAAGRVPTKAESKYPPKMEHELRKERLEKELRWRRELEGWGIRRSGSGMAWDEKWGSGEAGENPFSVYVELTEDDRAAMAEGKRNWEEESNRRDAE